MMAKLKKAAAAGVLASAIAMGGVTAANATQETVWHNGTPVYWDYGRAWGGWGYSKVFSSVYWHSATINDSYSEAPPKERAEAWTFVGFGQLKAYWNAW